MELENGQIYEMQGSGKSPYKIKNIGGVYSCSCPAWLNQNAPSNARTCKHIRKLRGDAAEELRLASAGTLLPPKPQGAEDKKELPLLRGEPWDWEQDLTGWWLSEKLDGVRAYWDGKQFLSRGHNIYYAPDWFRATLPDHPLDGELWIGRKQFQAASDIARSQGMPERWKSLRYLVFDAPDAKGPFEERMKFLTESLPSWKSPVATLVEQTRCQSNAHLEAELERILKLGGEGLMVRKPGSHYERTRSSTILKVKKFLDMEVIVEDYEPGDGRHKGRVGALWVKLSTGVKCKVGTGLKDKDRDNPPARGSVITVKYQELTEDGALRFPVFVGVRTDGDPNAPPPTRKKPKLNAGADTPTRTAPKPVSVTRGETTMTKKRYFEFVEGSSSKFWEVWLEGAEVVTQWGKIGTPGRETRKSFADETKAQKEYDKLVAEKSGKGYVETERPV